MEEKVEMTPAQFRNASGLKFKDISSEAWREYTFPSGGVTRLDKPLLLHVSASGGHRVFTSDGLCHYIQPTFENITWKVRSGKPHFVI